MVLDKGTREDDAYAQVNALLDDVGQLLDVLEVGRRKILCAISSLLEFCVGVVLDRLQVIVCGLEDFVKDRVLLGGLSLAGDERSDVEVDTASVLSGAAGIQGLLKLDVHETVALLVVDEEVHVVWRERLVLGEDGGRSHAVELAHLRRPLQHLHAVLVCVNGMYENTRPTSGVRTKGEGGEEGRNEGSRVCMCVCVPSETSNCNWVEKRKRRRDKTQQKKKRSQRLGMRYDRARARRRGRRRGASFTGIEVKTPRPRKPRASRPALPASKLATARSPPSMKRIFSSGASER